jgi:hypothetical protein
MEKVEMEPSFERIEKLKKEGFTKDFMVKDGYLTFAGSPVGYKPETIKIISHYRFEGISDPSDNSIVYAIETHDGTRGILTDAYGVYADEKTNKFIMQVEEIAKKEAGDVPHIHDDKASSKTDE